MSGQPIDRPGVAARVLMLAVKAYQAIPRSPIQRCRFTPTCSSYALQALERHGAVRGTWLALRRIARCHPFNPGGIDRVPEQLGGSRRLHRQGVGQ